MKLSKIVILVTTIVISQLSLAEYHQNKKVDLLQSADTRDCFFFRLSGVTQADPVTPNIPWFSVPLNHKQAKEIYSTLLAARTSDRSISVATTGQTECGHAGVSYLQY